MTGAVIITHGKLAGALLDAAGEIVGDKKNINVLEITPGESTDDISKALSEAVGKVDKKNGVIIFTDMFGGTPSNVSLSLLSEGSVEIIAGVNLPLIIKFLTCRGELRFNELTTMLVEYGQKSILSAGTMLKGKV
jgi:PTS system mannose-specific IIA component